MGYCGFGIGSCTHSCIRCGAASHQGYPTSDAFATQHGPGRCATYLDEGMVARDEEFMRAYPHLDRDRVIHPAYTAMPACAHCGHTALVHLERSDEDGISLSGTCAMCTDGYCSRYDP